MIHVARFEPGSAGLAGAGGVFRPVFIKAGHIATRHDHPFEQFLYVLSGSGRLECEQGTIPLEPGTALQLEPGAWHSAEFMADTTLFEFNMPETVR